MKAAIILFLATLDEKQKRLYAGLEALKLGHGGDRLIADLLSLDAHTVARGRRELLAGGWLRIGCAERAEGAQRWKKNA